MALAPILAVRRVMKEQTLGPVNPFPFVLMATNSMAWVLYGLLIGDYFVYTTNLLSALIGTYNALQTLSYAPTHIKQRMITTWIIIAFLGYFFALLCFVALPAKLSNGIEVGKTLMGVVTVISLLALYASPLITMYKVVKTRNSASINYPLAVAQLVNGGLWFVYGMAVGNYFVAGPNGTGCALGVLQVVLKVVFKSRGGETSDVESLETVVAEDGAEKEGVLVVAVRKEEHME
ncbi:hypothetical protein HDV00_012607 [Rhizophlyctis rosea]|nr:hypothetical protein HDV00_012607 [Rhizophlyctis rosea]